MLDIKYLIVVATCKEIRDENETITEHHILELSSPIYVSAIGGIEVY